MNDLKVYTAQEIADLLHISRRSFYNHMKAGKIKGVKRGKCWYFTEEEVKAYITPDTDK